MNPELLEKVRARLAVSGAELTAAAVAAAIRETVPGVVSDSEVLSTLRVLQPEFSGAGALEPLLRDPQVTDVLVAAADSVWVDRGEGLQRAQVRFTGDEAVRRLAQRLALAAGRRLDDAQPWVDAWLARETSAPQVRMHAVLAPVAEPGTCLSLRVLRPAVHSLAELGSRGMFADLPGVATVEGFPGGVEGLVREIVRARLAFLVSGGTGAGKTTLLGAMLGEVAPDQRIVCVEEAGELRPSHPHVIRLLSRSANVEGSGEVTIRDLVRQALRMRPDRLVVGEVRGAEVRELLAALNTGHEGGGGTVHANSPSEIPARLEALGALGGLSRSALHSQLAAAVDVVLHVARVSTSHQNIGQKSAGPRGTAAPGQRRLVTVSVLRPRGSWVQVVPVWQAAYGWGPGRARLLELLRERGSAPPHESGRSC